MTGRDGCVVEELDFVMATLIANGLHPLPYHRRPWMWKEIPSRAISHIPGFYHLPIMGTLLLWNTKNLPTWSKK